ncbi:MAG: glutamate ligase domain-containing protein, partial [Acidimicrobiales bacterium]
AYNVANALAAAAACDALGMAPRTIADGLLSFAQDEAANPGRLNLFARRGVLALVDFAHNEAGLVGLLEVCRRLAAVRGGRVRLALGTAGDRSDQILYRLGVVAAGADDLVICEKRYYLRGRDRRQMNAIFRAGARDGGYQPVVEVYRTELGALRALLGRSRRGDVAAVMSHVERAEIFAWLAANGFRSVTLARLRVFLAG